MREAINKILPYVYAGLILLAIDLVFLSDLLSGNVLIQPDMDNAIGMRQEVVQYYQQTGEATYWTNSMFGGMPTYQIWNPPPRGNLYDFLINMISLFTKDSFHYFFLLCFGSFLALCVLGIGPWLALIGTLAITYTSNHIGLLTEGHLTKLGALGFVPMILVGAILLFKKKWITGMAVFTFGLAACISQNHIQMTYYALLGLFIYCVLESYLYFKTKRLNELGKIIGCLVGGTAMAIAVNFSLFFSLHDYAKDTMRGGSILSTKGPVRADSSTISGLSGLGWDYAMQWSNGYSDLLSLLSPGATGGSSNEKWPGGSSLGKSLQAAGYPVEKEIRMPLYWGSLPFTSTPDYLGILIVLFFLIGIVIIKGPVKWFAVTSTVTFIILSLGKNLEFINRLVFDYLPYYNKFRAPNSILSVLSCTMPVFAVLSLHQFIQLKWSAGELKKLWMKTLVPLGSILLFLSFIGPDLFNMKQPSTDVLWQANTGAVQSILDARAYYLKYDCLRGLFLLLLGGAILYFYVYKKLTSDQLILGIGLVVLLDVWTVSRRYLDSSDFKASNAEADFFEKRAVDKTILSDTTLNYRVLDLSANTFKTAIPSYYHKTIGGHHAAKLRRYQDMIDYYFSTSNQHALDLMNTKYVIDKNQKLTVNQGALGNAWFVSTVKSVTSPDEEIAAISTINPANEAVILTKEFSSSNIQASYPRSGSITLTAYAPNHLTYLSQTSNEQLAVFSEVWYNPHKGWKSYIDGKEVDHVRVDYILRALKIPYGNHTIEFKFNPVHILAYNKITWVGKMLLGILILGWLFYEGRVWFNDNPGGTLVNQPQPIEKSNAKITPKKPK
ncbi:MAG: hypothetical protein ABIR66_05915 [Saprospiraceae bacterium]